MFEVVPEGRTLDFPRPRTLRSREGEAPAVVRAKGLSPEELEASLTRVTEALSARGLVAATQGGDTAAGLADLEAARSCAALTDDLELQGRVLMYLGAIRYHHADWDAALGHYEEALDLAHRNSDPWAECLALSDLGSLFVRQSRFEEARRYLTRSLDLSRRVGNRRVEGLTLTNLGLLDAAEGDIDAAEARYREAWPLLEEVEGYPLAGLANNLGVIAVELGRPDAEAILNPGLVQARRVGSRRFEAVILTNLGAARLDRGEPEGLDVLRSGAEILREIGDTVHVAIASVAIATELHCRGALDEALVTLEVAASAFQERDDIPQLTVRVEGRRAALLADLGRDATAALDRAASAARAAGVPDEERVLESCRAHLLDGAGRAAVAARLEVYAARSADLRAALRALTRAIEEGVC